MLMKGGGPSHPSPSGVDGELNLARGSTPRRPATCGRLLGRRATCARSRDTGAPRGERFNMDERPQLPTAQATGRPSVMRQLTGASA